MKTIAQQLNVKEFPFIIKDKNGNKIYFEDSHRYWWKREYDSNGNVTYSEDSYEFWYKKEYDSNGKVIYYEDSDGEIVDNRPKGCKGKVVEIDGKKHKLIEVNTKER